jgi:hypothetical protein
VPAGTKPLVQRCGSYNHIDRRSKVCLKYHIFHYFGPTLILVGVHLCALLKGTTNGESLKMAVGQQILSTSFTHAVNHVVEDELEEDVL